MAIGAIATGIANTNGMNASWVGTVNPKGVSKCTRVASASTRKHSAAASKPERVGRAQPPDARDSDHERAADQGLGQTLAGGHPGRPQLEGGSEELLLL